MASRSSTLATILKTGAIAVARGGTGASTAAEALVNLGLTATATELNYTDGVTSAIQTQLNAKSPSASPTFTGTPAAPTAAVSTNTTQIATTAFVVAEIAANPPPAVVANGSITSVKFSAATSLIIYNSAGTAVKTVYSPGS